MHVEKRRIVSAKNLFTPEEGFLTRQVFEDPSPRIRDFETEGEGLKVVPLASQIDVNGHVNNTKYANFVLDALSPEKALPLKEFRMEYHKEVLPGEKLNILTTQQDGTILARGENEAGEKMFSCHIETR